MVAQTMPTDQDEAVARIRPMTGEDEIDNTNFSGERLWEVCQRHGTLEAAAAEIWQMKAAKYAELVDTSEGGSSRRMGQLHANALAMSKRYNDLSIIVEPPPARSAGTTTRAIERP